MLLFNTSEKAAGYFDDKFSKYSDTFWSLKIRMVHPLKAFYTVSQVSQTVFPMITEAIRAGFVKTLWDSIAYVVKKNKEFQHFLRTEFYTVHKLMIGTTGWLKGPLEFADLCLGILVCRSGIAACSGVIGKVNV